MSSEVMVVFENAGRKVQAPGPEGEYHDYGAFIPRAARQLDEIAHGLGVSPLSSFLWSDPEMLREILVDLEGPAREKMQRPLDTQREWHDVSEGRRTVAALVDALGGPNPPEALRKERGGVPAVLSDLRALAALLGANEERFHLEAL